MAFMFINASVADDIHGSITDAMERLKAINLSKRDAAQSKLNKLGFFSALNISTDPKKETSSTSTLPWLVPAVYWTLNNTSPAKLDNDVELWPKQTVGFNSILTYLLAHRDLLNNIQVTKEEMDQRRENWGKKPLNFVKAETTLSNTEVTVDGKTTTIPEEKTKYIQGTISSGDDEIFFKAQHVYDEATKAIATLKTKFLEDGQMGKINVALGEYFTANNDFMKAEKTIANISGSPHNTVIIDKTTTHTL